MTVNRGFNILTYHMPVNRLFVIDIIRRGKDRRKSEGYVEQKGGLPHPEGENKG